MKADIRITIIGDTAMLTCKELVRLLKAAGAVVTKNESSVKEFCKLEKKRKARP
jgi:hypothetical protein